MRLHRGFTLIELLVVVAIIGMLSSVVIGSVNLARAKARDASVKSHARQLSTMMALQQTDTGSFAALQAGWDYTVGDCANSFSGAYAAKAREICGKIVELTNGVGLYTNVTAAGTNTTTHYSIMAFLPSDNTWFCIGSSGANSATTPNPADHFNRSGCPGNP